MKLGGTYAYIDIITNRHKLKRRLATEGPVKATLEVTIHDDPRGYADDGVSIEFESKIESIQLHE